MSELKTVYGCSSCPRWDKQSDTNGRCRLLPPQSVVVGMGEGIDRRPVPVTAQIYRITRAEDNCAFHPAIFHADVCALIRVVKDVWFSTPAWTRESGFSVAPGLEDAKRFAVPMGESEASGKG